jgi:hypothetical protein
MNELKEGKMIKARLNERKRKTEENKKGKEQKIKKIWL